MSVREAVIHCNAGADYGRGHLMRALALAEVARARGWAVSVVGDIDDDGLELARRMEPGLEVLAVRGPALSAALIAAAERNSVAHIDSYWAVPDLARGGAVVSNMQDGQFGVRRATLAIDANLGAEHAFRHPELSSSQLAGIDYAVIRNQVLRWRRDLAESISQRRRVLIVMGGTDPRNLTARMVRALSRIRVGMSVTVVDPRGRRDVLEAAEESPHEVDVVGFLDDLPSLARTHDLVVTASGTSVWDFACMGLPMALVAAVENQRAGYSEMVRRGLALGLGETPHESFEARIDALAELLADAARLTRMAERLRTTVDGLGTWRIVSAWEQLIDAPGASEGLVELATRGATVDDAQVLFDWRNDPTTRGVSRSQERIEWEEHRRWLERTLADPARRLFLFESGGHPVGTCRWDRLSEIDWEISITVAPQQRGRGLGSSMVAAAERMIAGDAPVRMLAVAHVDNEPSIRLFHRAGYLPHLPPDGDGFVTLAKWKFNDGVEGPSADALTADPR